MKKFIIPLFFLISISLIITCGEKEGGIIWEDNFDSYNLGMQLGESPNWDVLFGSDYGVIYKYQNSFGVKFFEYLDITWYYATGGSDNPNMRASVDIAETQEDGTCLFGIMTRVNNSKGYALICKKDHNSYNIQNASIYYFNGSELTLLASENIGKIVRKISIEAKGKDPVYINAYLDDITITTVDNYYNLDRGYGGIFYEYPCDCLPYVILDNFKEELATNI
jgi:hypothetical protein